MTQLPELPLTLSRQEIRKMIRQRRRALTPEQQQEMGQQAATRMMTYPPVVMAVGVLVVASWLVPDKKGISEMFASGPVP